MFKKDLFSLDTAQLDQRSKKVRIDWYKEMLQKYDRGASKDVYKIVTGDESWIYAYELETEQQCTVGLRRRAKSNESCSWKKHFETDGRLFHRLNWSCGDCST